MTHANGIGYVDIAADAEWAMKLRPLRAGTGYTTFTLAASLGTVLDIDGAVISLQPSAVENFGAVVAGIPGKQGVEWKRLGYDIQLHSFGGRKMAMLAVITVKSDRSAGLWSISARDHLVAYDLPLAEQTGKTARAMKIRSGAEGAWMVELGCSDENPLFEDINHNAVPDDFERQVLGQLVRLDSSLETRVQMERAWRERQYEEPQQFQLRIPAPDPMPEQERRRVNGAPIHGIPSSITIDSSLE